MSKKFMTLAAAALMMLAAAFIISYSEENDASIEYPVTIFYNPNATIVFDGTTVTYPNSAQPYGYGDPITITATIDAGYTFDHWYGMNRTEGEDWTEDSTSQYITINGNVVTYQTWCYGEEEYTLYLSGGAPVMKTITFAASPNNYGYFDMDAAPSAVGNTISVEYGTQFYVSDNGAVFVYTSPYTQFVYAEPIADYQGWHYYFDGWSWLDGTYTVTDDITVTAYFDRTTATFTVSFYAGTGGSVSPASVPNVPWSTAINVSGNTVSVYNTTVTATPEPGYVFSSWSNATGPVTGNRTITANFTQIPTYSVTITHNSSYGYVSQSQFNTVPAGASVTASGNVLTIGNVGTCTATPKNPTAFQTYSFTGWTIPSAVVSGNMEVTANFTAAYNDFPVTVYYNPNATIVFDGTTVTYPNSAEEYGYGDPITITATLDAGYTFDHWYGMNRTEGEDWTAYSNSPDISINGQTVTYSTWCYGEEEYTLYLSGGGVVTCTLTFAASPAGYGTVTSNSVTASYGDIWSISGNSFKINGQVVSQAIPATADHYYTYSFDGWSYLEASGTVIDDMSITAYFTRSERQYTDGVYWSNDLFNGKIDIVFKFAESGNMPHTMKMDLYNGTVGSNNRVNWSASGYSLEIVQTYSTTASITATLKYNGSPVPNMTSTVDLGKWMVYQITIDADNGVIYAMPVKVFTSYTDYTLYESQKKTILNYSSRVNDNAIYEIEHTDGDGINHVRFSVTNTEVFMDSYGVVLYNPSINVYDYFPQFNSIRLNFYSFALYGDSITVNGITYPVNGSKVTVTYVTDGKNNYLPYMMPNAQIHTKTMELSNIYVTWDGDTQHCSLTFVNDRFTIDLGSYTSGNETVSFAGVWFFTAVVYEPYAAVEKQISGWKAMPETSMEQSLLIFLGILAIAGVAVAIHVKRSGLGVIDIVIIAAAGLVAFILLG